MGDWGEGGRCDLHTLSKNNRYRAIADYYLNITVTKHRYRANLFLNGEPWLHKRALPDVPSHHFVIRVSYIY